MEDEKNKDLEDFLLKFPEIEHIRGRLPYGYKKKEGDPRLLVPDPAAIALLKTALDQLDAGISLRQVSEWLQFNLPDGFTISHQGLKELRYRYRPNFTRKRKKSLEKPLTKEEILAKRRRQKLGIEKRRIAAAEKAKLKLEAELSGIKANVELEKEIEKTSPSLLLEIDYDSDEFKEVQEELEVVFKPNPGPQTAFFAASEQEVLYGGAAGGELTSEFYRLLSPRGVKINFVNCWKPKGNQQPSFECIYTI